MSVPESGFTFQITFPTGGFWGLGLKPWDERERSPAEILPEMQQKLAGDPRRPDLPPSCHRRSPAAGTSRSSW